MDKLEILKDEFFVHYQRELETRQEQLSKVLNPNEYLVLMTEVNLLQKVLDSYVHYLEAKYYNAKETSAG